LGHLWCFHPSNLCICLGEICGLGLDLGDIKLSSCF
jgi:hypothetical protein